MNNEREKQLWAELLRDIVEIQLSKVNIEYRNIVIDDFIDEKVVRVDMNDESEFYHVHISDFTIQSYSVFDKSRELLGHMASDYPVLKEIIQ